MKKLTIFFIIVIIMGVLSTLTALGWYFIRKFTRQEPIKIGILHSKTGALGSSEKNLIDATLLAVEEINAQGGVLGRLLEPIIEDGQSNDKVFAQKAQELITEKVAVIFGCWSSASRKQVKPIIEQAGVLLFYPVQFEGLEESTYIIYTGATPNQSIIPAVTWSFYNLGKKFFLVGSDYIFPHAANEIIKYQAKLLGAEIVGEEYIPLGSKDVAQVIEKIKSTNPKVIFNTINGNTNLAFFTALRNAEMTPEKIATMSFSLSEPEIVELGISSMVGDYAAWNYFQSIDTPENVSFVKRFKKRYGKDRVVSNNMESAYVNVYLWTNAVRTAKTLKPKDLLPILHDETFAGPEGVVYLDDDNHSWSSVYIGKIRYDGQFDIVWNSKKAIKSVLYPPYQDKNTWEKFLTNLYESWDKQWAKPS